MFWAIIGATDTVVLSDRESEVANDAFRIVASMDMSEPARTSTSSPFASRSLLMTFASAPVGAVEAISVPISASTVLKRKFCAFTPIELKASTTPTLMDVPPPSAMVVESTSAISVASLSARTSIPPAAASSALSSTMANALARITLDAIVALTATVLPPTKTDPPSALAEAVFSESIRAISVACTTISPPAASTVALLIVASTRAKISLVAISPPTAVESLEVAFRLTPGGTSASKSTGVNSSQFAVSVLKSVAPRSISAS